MRFADIHKGNLRWLPERMILFVRAGSYAYGTNVPGSDIDYRGIAIPPREYFLGFTQRFESVESGKGASADYAVYDIRKYMALAADCNPNVLELLYVDDADILEITPAGEMLRAHRKEFLSRVAQHRFSGYAMSQLKRIRRHRHWLLDPPKRAPRREDYSLPTQQKVLSHDQMGAYDELIKKGKLDPKRQDPAFILALQREKEYLQAQREWEQYQKWRANRNPKRAELERRHGFDCKHAMHLARLMRMGREILTTGEVIVKRPDAAELLAIRNGAWTYDQLIEWAERQDAELRTLAQTSSLQRCADRPVLDALCIEIVERSLAAE